MGKRKPQPVAEPRKQSFFSDSTVHVVGDSLCLTFHRAQGDEFDGEEVEVWMPLGSAGTAAMALLEAAFPRRIAEAILRRADHAAYKAWLAADPDRKPQDWAGLGL